MTGPSVIHTTVSLSDRSYTVHTGPGALALVAPELRRVLGPSPNRALIVHDLGVPAPTEHALANDLRAHGFTVTTVTITPTEEAKSLATLERVLVALGSSGHSRIDPVIALGGGIVGDLAGFAAASWQRGVPVAQCPTTLLSMADASVGGKTGVNLTVPSPSDPPRPRLLKNMVGAFHQPALVAADTAVLASLPDRHRRAGLAECIKHALISTGLTGLDLLDDTRRLIPAVRNGDAVATAELLALSVRLKAEVVRRDERESTESSAGGDGGERMLLNLGHTFGHAIETIPHLTPDPARPDLAPLHHGEAVALGMVAACEASRAAGLCGPEIGQQLASLLHDAGLPTRVAGLPATDEILARMGSDKKAAGGAVRLILPTGRGTCRVVRGLDPGAVRAGIDAMRA
jgi:3-dehydroquinate synthase